MNRYRRLNAAWQPLKDDPSFIGLGGFNFSKRIIKKYSFSKRAGRLPALVFLRLFGLRDAGIKNSVETNTGPEWRINNYFEFHFYTGVTRKLTKAPEGHPQKQYNVSYYSNMFQPGVIRCLVTQRSSAPQKFFQVFGGSAPAYPAVEREGLLSASYTITGSDKPTVKSTVKLTVLPARHITGSYLQKIFNMVNTGSGSPATATKETLIGKSENPDGNIPTKYEMNGKNVLFPVSIPITSSAKLTLNAMNLSINNYSHRTGAKDAVPKNNKTAYAFPSGIQNSNKGSRYLELVRTKMKMNVQKMNERLSGRKQGTFPDNIVPAAKPDLHFASNSGKTEKPVRTEDTIDTIVRKHTDLVLRKTSGDNIANNIRKQDVMKATNEEVRERNINKSISQERKPDDINTIADTVYKLIERRLLIEKEKRGLV
ncbi:Uncharacterised protein [uncultured archaeon]|nr:Uncharacterised protein [uncultured archaeon]